MNIQRVLQHPQGLCFPAHHIYKEAWESSGGKIIEQPTGHCVLYGQHGRRILMSDPEGHPLHECLWEERESGTPILLRARIRLDWGQWVGIIPKGLVNSISIDLTRRPGWQKITRNDLRNLAAKSLNSNLETIQFFYRDEDFQLRDNGQAVIRQVKDAFYVLRDGSFEQSQFMSCMSRMDWAHIDYLPVVELFLSLLPGTGSATFELIRGLYDDQNHERLRTLHYRGIPVYPSEGAFRLFSAFFTPLVTTSESPLEVFLNPDRSEQVQWHSSLYPPVRYMDEERGLGITVQNHKLQKVTCWHDPAGLPYFAASTPGRLTPDGRMALILNQEILLHDGSRVTSYKKRPSWQISEPPNPIQWEPPPSSWRNCFPQAPPEVSPLQAFSTVLLYPNTPQEIGEKESQPFVFDYLDDFLDQNPELLRKRAVAERVLISHCDAALGSCLKFSLPQHHTVWYTWPDFSQKSAQQVWNRLNRSDQLAHVVNFQFIKFQEAFLKMDYPGFDFMYLWIPFSDYPHSLRLEQWITFISKHLATQGIACIAGPTRLGDLWLSQRLEIILAEPGASLPTFHIHQTILPSGWLNGDLTVWIARHAFSPQ